ncbi:hypothetical protein GH5_00818 [Leishmania sp. Ghana 2012 LV757]|uniref:hypothetical protein n=1 Tax=Leishmania sp. Ghana 2012 LV757 TaxID=2803181 RepID=UPI001B6CC651|nr:hypothetical protein GH5_00818 [Leishmania sp. Ghana 2012 LV757]
MHISEVLLLGFTLASLGFSAWRQTSGQRGDPDDETEDRDEHMARAAPLAIPVTHVAFSGERGFCKPPRNSHASDQRQRTPAAQVLSDGADVDNVALSPGSTDSGSAAAVDVTVDAGASLSLSATADPLLTVLSRLPLEEKLSITVNWLSSVSNCLTYFLRPSQVLYTFLFTNGHLVLFATSYSRRYLHLHPDQLPARRQPALYASFPSESRREACVNHWLAASRAKGATTELQISDTVVYVGSSGSEPASVIVPPPSMRSLFKSVSTVIPERRQHHGNDYHSRGSCVAECEVEDPPFAGEGAMAPPPHPSPPTVTLRRPRRWLRWYLRRGVAPAQAQLSGLLIFNALFTAILFIFHQYYLFFELGTLSGYMAAVASVFLCGMETGCIVVRLRRRWQRGRTAQTPSEGAAVDGMPSTDDLLLGADPYGGVQGPAIAYLGEHLSTGACAALYVWMLLDEGDALWVSHTALVRWYVCPLFTVIFSVLKCLRVFF